MQLIEHLRNLDDLIVRGANTAKIRNQLSACIEQAEAEMDCPEKLSALQAKHSELQNAHQKTEAELAALKVRPRPDALDKMEENIQRIEQKKRLRFER